MKEVTVEAELDLAAAPAAEKGALVVTEEVMGVATAVAVATVEAELDLAVATAVEKAVEVKNFHRSSRFRPIP